MRHKPMYRYRNRYASSLWRQVLHPARIRQAHFGVGCRSYRKQGTSGQGKEYALFSGTGSRNSIKSHSCAVLSGDGIALLLTPGTGISKPPMVSKRHDTDGRWRQVTKLPRPCPQYPPFTLRYGNLLVLHLLAAHGGSGITSAGHRPSGFPLVPLMLSY